MQSRRKIRSFNTDVVRTDFFLSMPPTAQLLYMQLLLEADDEGVFANASSIRRMLGINEDDFSLLLAKGFIIALDEVPGVYVFKHWLINNPDVMDMDDFAATRFPEVWEHIGLKPNDSYAMLPAASTPLPAQAVVEDAESGDSVQCREGGPRLRGAGNPVPDFAEPDFDSDFRPDFESRDTETTGVFPDFAQNAGPDIPNIEPDFYNNNIYINNNNNIYSEVGKNREKSGAPEIRAVPDVRAERIRSRRPSGPPAPSRGSDDGKAVRSSKIPTREEVRERVKEKGFDFDPDEFYDYYEALGWKNKYGEPIRAWKSSCAMWQRNCSNPSWRPGARKAPGGGAYSTTGLAADLPPSADDGEGW